VGQGWSLNGLPAITRDTTNGIKYDGTDSYIGSGGRLKLHSGRIYHHEYENYSRVVRNGSIENPNYWVETRPDGTKYYYGNYDNSDSAKSANIAAVIKEGFIRVWALSKVEDLNGNYYRIEYSSANGEYYPHAIAYTLRNGGIISQMRTVEFVYEDRDDYYGEFSQSSVVVTRNRLSKIIVKVDVTAINIFNLFQIEIGGTTVREYILNYRNAENPGSSKLISIDELDKNGLSINRSVFTWSSYADTDPDYIVKTFTAPIEFHPAFGSRMIGDMNGDGKADLVSIFRNIDLGLADPWVSTWFSNGDGNFNLTRFNSTAPCNNAVKKGAWLIGDINGDGKADLANMTDDGRLGLIGDPYIDTWISNDSGGFNLYRTATGQNARGVIHRMVGDVNGDGKADFIEIKSNEIITYAYTDNGKYFISKFTPPHPYLFLSDNWQTGDINGDGKTDLINITPRSEFSPDYCVSTWFSKGDGTFYKESFIPPAPYDNNSGTWQSGDINGDGKTDFVNICESFIYTWISRGNGTFKLGKFTPPVSWSQIFNPAVGICRMGDINGDGKSDIVNIAGGSDLKKFGTNVNSYINTWISEGDGSFIINQIIPSENFETENCDFFIGDVNGDGRADFIQRNSDSNYIKTWITEGNEKYITNIKTTAGAEIKIDYEPAKNFYGAIIPTGKTYPVIADASPRNLVKSLEIKDGRLGSYLKSYNYYNGKFRTGLPEDRKKLFFERITETDFSTGIKTSTTYDQRRWHAGSPVLIKVTGRSGKTLKTVNFEYDSITATIYNNTHFVKLNKVETEVFESGQLAYTQSRTFTYDEDGNTTDILDYSSGTPSVVTAITYDKNKNENILNRPSTIQKISDGTVIQDDVFTYENNNLKTVTKFSDQTTEFGYDNYGNITSIKDPSGQITDIKYDNDYNTFIAKVTNPLGHTVLMETDPATGNPLTKTDQNGNITELEYDGAGRLEKVINAYEEVVQEIDYHDNLRGNPDKQYTETKVYSDSDTAPTWSRNYYDGLGRVYKTVSYAGTLNSADITQQVDITFDTAGRVHHRTIPYINGKQEKLYIYYEYDEAGRVIKEKRPVSENTANQITIETGYTAVSGRIQVTKRDPKGNVSTAQYDSRGRLRVKTEPETAQVTYDYDGAGRLKQTIDAGNHITKIAYDSQGRKESITDPNSGEISYLYDIMGNMTYKTDAIGNTISYSYDSINRLKTIDYPDDTPDVTYTYDEPSQANGIGRVTTVASGDILTKYSYDENGNTNYLREKVENIDFIFTMEYDRQNRRTALTYPDGTRIENEYSETGYLKAVKQGGGAYIQYALKLDGTGEYKNSIKRVTGNGVETLIGFNPATMKPEAIESRNKTNTLLEQLDYEYDEKTGNITDIKNTFDTAKSQTFEYDNLNRLKKAKGVYGEENYSYTPSGNLEKNARGSLLYNDSLHPYAVTTDGEGNSYTYDANGQMTSGRGREMEYDAAGRLAALKKDGVEIQKNTYDHTGHRVLHQKKDGTLIYNIAGMYEIVKTAGRPDYHTKYIYGMEGDLAAQVTTEGTALIEANFGHGYIFDKGYGGNPLISVLAKGYIKTDKFFSRAKNILKLQYVLVLILLAMFTGALVRSGITEKINRLKNKRVSVYAQPVWTKATSYVLVISMIGSFSLTGCDELMIGTGGSGGSTTVTADTAGLPTLGTYYFHPDHIGSVSYITDHEGNVVTRMYYTPYGEKVKSASTGPDIFHQKYTGQVDDGEEAELLYYNARYYDPKLGRFISADSIIPDPGFSQSFNRYMYVVGNPVSFNDPTGHYEDSPGPAAPPSPFSPNAPGHINGGGGSSGGSIRSNNESYVSGSYQIIDNKIYSSRIYMPGNKPDAVEKNIVNESEIESNNCKDDENAADARTGKGHGGSGGKTNGRFINPLPENQMKVWSRWGWRINKINWLKWKLNFHYGIDLGAQMNTPVYAVADGMAYLDNNTTKFYGRRIIIDHGDGLQTEYSHLSRFNVIIGKVKQGDIIGYTGNSGPIGTPKHLHFAVVLNGRKVDPELYLDLKNK
jgi:RHS repeat-associated protein